MTEKVNLPQQIQQYRQANPKCNNLSDKQILSILIESGQITLTEAQKNSIFLNNTNETTATGLNIEKNSNTQTANVPDVIVKSSDGKTYNFNKTLENRINNVTANLKKAEDSNGFIGKAWSGFKNLTGIGDSSDKVREQQEVEKKLLAQFNSNGQRRPQIFKELTGVDYTPENLEKFIKGEIILKSEQALTGYKEGQEMAADVIADVGAGIVSYGTAAVCVAGGIAAAPFTAGASLTGVAAGIGIAAGTGAVVKTGIKYADAKSAGREYSLKDAGHDCATGAFSGALAPVTAGAGAAIGKGAAVQTTKVLGKTALKEGTKQTVTNAVKFTAEVTSDGALGGGVDNSFRAAVDGGNAKEIFEAGVLGAEYGAVLGPVMGWGGKAIGKGYKAAKQTLKTADNAPLSAGKDIQIESKKIADINDDSGVLTKEKQVIKNGKPERQLELNEIGEKKAREAAGEIHKKAVEAENAILKLMKKAGLGTAGVNMTHRPKSAQSLYDKIKNAVCDPKHPSSFKEAVKSIRDAVGTRTELADFNYKKHPDIVEMYKKDPKKAIQMAAERQSEEYVQKVKDIITNSVTDPDAQLKAIRISNYMGKDGIPYFSEKQVAILQDHAAQYGIDLHVKDNLTKVRASGYTALQMNFQTKEGFTFEWQLRGSKINQFAECEHVPYDIREDKDVTGGRGFLKALYEPIEKTVKGLNPEEFNRYNEYLTAHYEHLRKLELGFDSTPPKLEDFNLKDPKLKAENLENLHEISDKLKNGEITESQAVLDYFFKTSAPEMSNIHPDIAKRLDELSHLYNGIKDEEILGTITNIMKETSGNPQLSPREIFFRIEASLNLAEIYHAANGNSTPIVRANAINAKSETEKYMQFLKKYNPSAYDDLAKKPSLMDRLRKRDWSADERADLKQAEKFQHLIEFISNKSNNTELCSYLYKEYYLNKANLPKSVVQKCLEIDKEYGVKIIPSQMWLKEPDKYFSQITSELDAWKNASGGKAKFPPAIDALATKIQYMQGAVGTTSVQNHDIMLNPRMPEFLSTLRHELTHLNDTKFRQCELPDDWKAYRTITYPDGTSTKVLDEKNCKYANELHNAGLDYIEDIPYAFTNADEFIAKAAEGDMSKYSPEFKQVLVSLGMPEWVFKLNAKTENVISIPSGKFSAPVEKLEKGYILDAKTNKPVKVDMNKIKIDINDYMNSGTVSINDEFGNQLGIVTFDMRNTHAGLPGIHFEGLVSNVEGLGIGTKLIDELVKMSKAKGCEGRLLATASPMKGVNGKLTNLEFYYKKGFKAVSPEKHTMIEECIQQNKEIPLALNFFTEIEYIPQN